MPISGGITVPNFHFGVTDPDTLAYATILSGIVSPAGVTNTNENLADCFRRWLGLLGTLSGVVSGSLAQVSGMQHEMALRIVQLEGGSPASSRQITAANAIITASGEFNNPA